MDTIVRIDVFLSLPINTLCTPEMETTHIERVVHKWSVKVDKACFHIPLDKKKLPREVISCIVDVSLD